MSLLLAPLTPLYSIGVTLDRLLRPSKRLSKPVVSIGNISTGGTGKTPLLIHLAGELVKRSKSVAVLSRNYQSHISYQGMNDEALLLKDKIPQVILGLDSNRKKKAQEILDRFTVDFFLLDDGFQHWSLKRDVDIVCIDSTNPFGNGHLLPWGILRESVSSLKRASSIVMTRTELSSLKKVEEIKNCIQEKSRAPIFVSSFIPKARRMSDGKEIDLSEFITKKGLAVSAIGNPVSFEQTLHLFQIQIHPLRFRDHHAYMEKDLNRIVDLSFSENRTVFVTEKDWVKLKQLKWEKILAHSDLIVVRQEISFGNDTSAWENYIDRQILSHEKN
ncbi:MAG: tetraacyldisaccharide 4'-kinase [Elusimicrobiota bacterium]